MAEELNPYQEYIRLIREANDDSEAVDRFDLDHLNPESVKEYERLWDVQNNSFKELMDHVVLHHEDISRGMKLGTDGSRSNGTCLSGCCK